jgi:hypothetical protein
MQITLSAEIRDYLKMIIEDDVESHQSHLRWLDANPNEADRDQQRTETERAIELAGAALTLLGA